MDQPATKSDIQEVKSDVQEVKSDIQEVLATVRELSTRVDRLSEKLDATKEQLVNHTNGIAAEFHTQIQDVEGRLTIKISAVEKRLELQGGLVQSGSRAMARFIEWTEKTDFELSRYENRLTLLEKRVNNLEANP